MKKRILSLVLVLCMLISVFPCIQTMTVSANENFKFTLTDDTLTISGNGSLKYIPNNMYDEFISLKYKARVLIFEEGITEIGEIFTNQTMLEKVVFPKTLKSLGVYTFRGCTNLKEVEFPDTEFEILGGTFERCTNLKEVYIPSSATLSGYLPFGYDGTGKLDLTIYTPENSNAYKYAKDNDINVVVSTRNEYNQKFGVTESVILTPIKSDKSSYKEPSFKDIKTVDEYTDYIIGLGYLNLFKGDENGNFNPESTITRAEFSAIVCRMLGYESEATKHKGKTVFNDVPSSHWASGYIFVASQLGIINGYGNGLFGPEDSVTYEQAIKMLVCAIGYNKVDICLSAGVACPDDTIPYPDGYMAIAKKYDLIDSLYKIGDNVPRKVIAKLLYTAISMNGINIKDGGNGEAIIKKIFGFENITALEDILSELLKNNKGDPEKEIVIPSDKKDPVGREEIQETIEVIVEKTTNLEKNIALEKLIGTYSGSYFASQGETGLTLTVFKEDDQYKAIFDFYNLPGRSNAKHGKYYMNVDYDEITREYSFESYEWIEQPSWYGFVNLKGTLINGVLSGNNPTKFKILLSDYQSKDTTDFIVNNYPSIQSMISKRSYENWYNYILSDMSENSVEILGKNLNFKNARYNLIDFYSGNPIDYFKNELNDGQTRYTAVLTDALINSGTLESMENQINKQALTGLVEILELELDALDDVAQDTADTFITDLATKISSLKGRMHNFNNEYDKLDEFFKNIEDYEQTIAQYAEELNIDENELLKVRKKKLSGSRFFASLSILGDSVNLVQAGTNKMATINALQSVKTQYIDGLQLIKEKTSDPNLKVAIDEVISSMEAGFAESISTAMSTAAEKFILNSTIVETLATEVIESTGTKLLVKLGVTATKAAELAKGVCSGVTTGLEVIGASMALADFFAGSATEAKAAIDLRILVGIEQEIQMMNQYYLLDIMNGKDYIEEYVQTAEVLKPIMMYGSYLTNVIYTAKDKCKWSDFVRYMKQEAQEYNDFDRIYQDEVSRIKEINFVY